MVTAASAAIVTIADAGSYFEGSHVEAALQENGYIITDITDDVGKALLADDDFKTMLKTAEPSGSPLKEAWKAYKPLRDYIVWFGVIRKSRVRNLYTYMCLCGPFATA